MRYLIILGCIALAPVASADEWRGELWAEYQGFASPPLDIDQHRNYTSLAFEPEYYRVWNDGRQSMTLKPYYRWDQFDDSRTHGDIREFFWLYNQDAFEFNIGLRKVFWGTTESQHLVDVINQTDLVDNPDGEEKLGQPMLSVSMLREVVSMQLYLLPYFRERTFAGEQGRLRTLPRIETERAAVYESDKKNRNLDWAIRWTMLLRSWDIGLSQFCGTNREPRLLPVVNNADESVLLPSYELMHQTGLDIQGAAGAWLLKLETIYRKTKQNDFMAGTGGFEYTLYNIYESGLDVGIVMEYLYDERGDKATTPFNDDIMLGIRLTPNDVQSTEFLLAIIQDRDNEVRSIRLEASRRLTDHLKIMIEGRGFAGLARNDPLYSLRRDDYLQLGLGYFF